MFYKVEFDAAIRRHRIYKDTWHAKVGQILRFKKDHREEAKQFDKHSCNRCLKKTPVKDESESTEVTTDVLFGHIPIEISKLILQFLLAWDKNVLTATVTGKRKGEVGLVVPSKYVALTKLKEFACILKEKKHPRFEMEVKSAMAHFFWKSLILIKICSFYTLLHGTRISHRTKTVYFK